MNIPTVKQYKEAISNRLSSRQIEILQTIYRRPNSAATALELAEDMGYKGFQGANRQIGAIGKAIYEYTGVEPPIYEDRGERYAYYYMVGDYTGPGWKLWKELRKALESLDLTGEKITKASYSKRLPPEVMPFEEEMLYKEGKVTEVFVNRYERNQKARIECIKHFGVVCQGCDFDFGKFYGNTAQGFIEIHHILPLSEIGNTYTVDPVNDLVPLCANCHSVVHLTKPALSLFELRKLTKKRRK